mmetsp:Transcript_45623/g.108597  ORF Transcript_45623/g.108597 Transcript_45623/m.108597 type:complete len:1111 (+) Transcript_45623:106-3438(+)
MAISGHKAFAFVSFFLAACSPASAARLHGQGALGLDVTDSDLDSAESMQSQGERWDPACCCKEGVCEGNDGKQAIFSPNRGLCCRPERRGFCGHIPIFEFKTPAPSPAFCEEAQTSDWDNIKPVREETEEEVVPTKDLERGSPEHTVRTYCDLSHADQEDAGSDSSPTEGSKEQDALASALVKEMKDNSLDQMVKEIFSLFVCMRWAPSPDFKKAAAEEVATGQIKYNKSAYALHSEGHFIPLRCTRSVNVYDAVSAIGQDHFETFEAEMEALSKWYDGEHSGAVIQRLEKLHSATDPAEVESLAESFDMQTFKSHVYSKCKDVVESPFKVDTAKASTKDLLSDCNAAKWWLAKLKDWEEAMPFNSFMSPDMGTLGQDLKPKPQEHLVVCFGKRVASQLHRRAEGNHLMTDQNMVGCHGFWELTEGSKMLDRIVRLWRPPTCQLAALELDLKIKLMEVIVSMNTRLFDALPAMLTEEMTDMPSFDGKLLEASHGLGIAGGMLNSIVGAFKSLKGTYVRLGQLLGNTVVKWVVCPVKPGFNDTQMDALDQVLGTEDDLARDYARIAYSKWTGEKNKLPGEECEPIKEAGDKSMKNLLQCQLGLMQESMPEPYKGVEFLCPVRPLLPGKQQAEIISKVHKGWCPVFMNQNQLTQAEWFYRGWTPQKKQYNVTENTPSEQMQTAKMIDFFSRPDQVFHIWRDFVKVAKGCSPAEAMETPRWCGPLPVVNDAPGAFNTFLSGAKALTSTIGDVTGRTLEALNVTEKKPRNHMSVERFQLWMSGTVKSFDKWWKSASSAVIGRASDRYDRLHQRTFAEMEVNELVHASSFQSLLDNTGADSKHRKRFDRFAVLAPCSGMDPEEDFRFKYVWTEKALSIAKKAHEKFGSSGLLTGARAFSAQLRAEVILHLKSADKAWVEYLAHVRAAGAGKGYPEFVSTRNPFLMDLVGADPGGSGSDIHSASLFGFEAKFACGTRTEMHNLDVDEDSLAGLQGSFADCVKKGAARNKQLKAASPTTTFFRDAFVVRVVLAPLDACYSEGTNGKFAKDSETVNPLYKTFMQINACKPLEGTQTKELEAMRQKSSYRGMVLGAGLPVETLTEVLIEPEDFLSELDL